MQNLSSAVRAQRQPAGILGLGTACLLIVLLLAPIPLHAALHAVVFTECADSVAHCPAEQLLAQTLRIAPTGIGIVKDRVFLDVNDYILALTGYSRAELIGQSTRILYPTQADYEHVGLEKYRQIRETGVGSMETRWLRKDGEFRYVRLASTPLDPQDLSLGIVFTVLDITELKQSEERFAKAFRSSPTPMALSEIATGRLIDVNDRTVELLGYSRAEIIGRTTIELGLLSNPEDRGRIIQKLEEQGFFKDEPTWFRTKSGEDRLALWSGEVITLEGRQVLLSLLYDDTERRQAEATLAKRTSWFMTALTAFSTVLLLQVVGLVVLLRRRNQATRELKQQQGRLQSILEGTNIITWEWNVQTGEIIINDQSSRIAGYTLADLAPVSIQAWRALIHPDDLQACREVVARHFQDKQGYYEIEYRVRHKDGGWAWVLDRGKTMFWTEDNKPLWMYGLLQDITARKTAEKRIIESEQRFRAIFDNSPVSIMIFDKDTGEPVAANRAAYTSYGFASLEDLQKRVTWLEPPYSADDALRLLRKAANDGLQQFEWKSQKITGEEFWCLCTLMPVIIAGQECVLGIGINITACKQAEQEREKLQSQLLQTQKMESLGTLTSGVAHDFNNLLQVIGGNLDLLMQGKPAGHPDVSRLQGMSRAVDRAAQLVRQLLIFSRKADPRKMPVDLNQVVQESVYILERSIPKMIALELRLAAKPWTVLADPVQIEQIIINLANNAVDAMPEGGRLVIETDNVILDEKFARINPGASEGRHVLLTVTDTGCGMDKKVLQHAFDPFFTTKDAGKGSGLGLASVYGIVKAHGGHIQCYSEPGLGTTFKIYFPATATAQGETGMAMPTPNNTFQGGNETILVVDDDPTVRAPTKDILEILGYNVLVADNGEHALDLYQKHGQAIDLVLLDLNMPGMGGQRCLQELLQLDPRVKVVIASGYNMANDPDKGDLPLGAKGFLGKPFQLRELAVMVRKVLGG